MKALTKESVREAVTMVADNIIRDYKDKPETDRETLIERLDEETDVLFGSLVRHVPVHDYTVQDLVQTAQPCATIIEVADEDAWVEDDEGLWEDLTFGVLASVAFFSLRNLLYSGLKNAGYDTNDDKPFAKKEDGQ